MWQCCGSDPYHLPRTGVTHGDDLPYLFPMSPLPEEVVTEEQKKVRQLPLSDPGAPPGPPHTPTL